VTILLGGGVVGICLGWLVAFALVEVLAGFLTRRPGTNCAMDLFIIVVHLRCRSHCCGSGAASSKIATRTGYQ
jgi:hypothetical protein